MKALAVVGCLALVGCDDEPTTRPTAVNDSLWKLAPEGTRGALVISPYSIGMVDGAMTTLRAFLAKGGEELVPVGTLIDDFLGGLGPLKDLTLGALHLTPTKGAAVFFVKESTWVAIVPIKDRDAFVAKAKGKRATTPEGTDMLDDKVACKQLGQHYTCASTEPLLATLGKSAIGDRIKKLRTRGDIELVATELPFQGLDQPRSSLAAAITLERGTWVIRGMLGNPPESISGKLAATPIKPRTTAGKSAGFGVFDIRQFLDPNGTGVVIEGVTEADVVKSVSGPMTIDVPAGAFMLDVQIPLADPAPLTKVLAGCTQVKALVALGAANVDGACRIKLAEVGLELDLWIENSAFRIGKKAGGVAGKSVPMSPVAKEIAAGTWSFAFWGRGTMFAKQAKDEANDVSGAPPQVAAPIRALSMLNEIGFGIKKDNDDLRFVITMRTGFANPKAVVDQITDIKGIEVLGNTASGKAAPIATAHPASEFGADFAAGQHGLLLPTQMLERGINLLVPALIRYTRGEKPQPERKPPAPGEMTAALVKAYVVQGYPVWKDKNPTQPCPGSIGLFAASVGPTVPTKDEWGNELVVKCGKDLPQGATDIAIISAGPDGKLGTDDDIKSY